MGEYIDASDEELRAARIVIEKNHRLLTQLKAVVNGGDAQGLTLAQLAGIAVGVSQRYEDALLKMYPTLGDEVTVASH